MLSERDRDIMLIILRGFLRLGVVTLPLNVDFVIPLQVDGGIALIIIIAFVQ